MTAHRALAAAAFILAIAAIGAGEARPAENVAWRRLAADVAHERDHVSAITLAEWLRAREPGLHLIDLRDSTAFEEMHIPGATWMSVEAASALDLPRGDRVVLYSEGGTHAAQVWFILRTRGYENVFFLREGLYEWASRVMRPMLPVDASPEEREAYAHDAELARYFGGTPQRDVERNAMPDGYWRHETGHDDTRPDARDAAIRSIRRRGC